MGYAATSADEAPRTASAVSAWYILRMPMTAEDVIRFLKAREPALLQAGWPTRTTPIHFKAFDKDRPAWATGSSVRPDDVDAIPDDEFPS